jgi:hypothetical protein
MEDKRKIEILDQFFDSSITTDYNKSLFTNCYVCYENMTADGYDVYVFAPANSRINVNDHIYYYNDDLCRDVLFMYEQSECPLIYVEDDLAEKIYLRSEQLELFEEYLPDILKSDLITEEEHEELLEDEEY